MPPAEYLEIDGVILNGTDGSTPWWCDFDLSPLPVWGNFATKGSPWLEVPHADEDLELPVHGAGVTFSLLGVVYGEFDQTGAPVSGFGEQRMQLADNLAVLAGLRGGPWTLTYVLYDLTYTGSVLVLGSQGASSGPLDRHPTGPVAQPVALKLSVAAGALALTGS